MLYNISLIDAQRGLNTMEKDPTTSSEETPEEDAKETPEPIEGEEAKEEDSSSQIDYDAITKEEEEKAEPKTADEAFKERSKERKEKEEKEETTEPTLTREEAQEMIVQATQATQKTMLEVNAAAMAGALAESDPEARAILAKWKNRVFPDEMPLQEQMEEMHIIVNRKRFVSENSEVKRALLSKDKVSKDSAGTHRDSPEGDEPKLTAADADGMKNAGLKWDGAKSLWYKNIGRNQRMETKGPGHPSLIVDR